MRDKEHIEQPTYDEFLGYLRSALHYLYDPVHLRHSPLVVLLGLTGEFNKAAVLQNLLTETIQSFKPGEDEPPQSSAWRVYDTLSLLYIQQFTRNTVAAQLGISDRQLRREQRLALEALAFHLWKKNNLPPASINHQTSEIPALSAQEKELPLNKELEWLGNQEGEHRIDLSEILNTVYVLAQPLAQKMKVSLQINADTSVAEIQISEQAIRNILLTILNAVIPEVKEEQVTISADYQEPNIIIKVACPNTSVDQANLSGANNKDMETAQRLASFHNVEFSIHKQETSFVVSLSFLALERIPVLVIDDNADWLDMLKRYAVGSRYQVVGTRDSETACSLAERIRPAVILLDVMLPKMDGWQVLSELRHGQATGQIPIVVCTVLPLEGLALSLGVNAFLQKPVKQDQFLAMLEKVINQFGWPSKPSLV